jgi:hypothetical protein
MKKSFTVFFLLLNTFCFAQKVTLALNLTQGNTYYMTSHAKMDISQIVNGQQQDITTTIRGGVSYKVTAVKDSVYVMEVRYESIGMQMAMQGQNFDFYSGKKDTTDVFSTLLSALINKPFSVVITRRGKILSIDNIENLYAGMFDSLPQLTADQKTQLKAQIMKSYGPDSFRGTLEQVFAVYPDAKVAKNDQWVVNTKVQSVMTAKTKTTYTLDDITENTYNLHGVAAIQSDDKDDYKESNGLPMKFINVTGSSTIDLKLDKATGWINEEKAIIMITGTIDVKDNPKIPGGMTIPMTVSGETTISNK